MNPVKEMISTISKPRPGSLRLLLIVQLFAYGLLWFNTQWSFGLEYNYMLLVFKNFTSEQFSYYNASQQILMSLFMLFIMPKLKLHESLYCVLSLSAMAIAYFILPWISNLWAYIGTSIHLFNHFKLLQLLSCYRSECFDHCILWQLGQCKNLVYLLCWQNGNWQDLCFSRHSCFHHAFCI